MRRRPDRTLAGLLLALLLPVVLPVVLAVRLALSLTSYARLCEWLPQSTGQRNPLWVRQVARAVSIVSRLVPGATCLTQAVATRTLLAWMGHESWIRIGVRRSEDGSFQAHAWLLDHRARPIIGGRRQDLAGFNVLADLDGLVRQ
ncbi:hypothetical protein CG471_27055 [Sphingobium sp. IP1]|uniref:lasso peptide biosynthesis B2 protein n=1 Tax=Sphingobium sp. IP1 TaxID=2021637 RepID=UPI000C0698E0|nr:lasso peptide biosynthesis B2 protein [Sphingobium sp. IP1]PHP16627.1 hypothetical protein CG471_27055 [Sphingobium sp. IP1]